MRYVDLNSAVPPFDDMVCRAVHNVLKCGFDIDFAIMRGGGEYKSVYWYEIHPEGDEENPIEPSTAGDLAQAVYAAVHPLFVAIGVSDVDDAVGQEFFMGHNWLRVTN